MTFKGIDQADMAATTAPTVPTRVTRVEAERMIAEVSASDLPELQALGRRLRATLDAAPAQTVFHFWPCKWPELAS